MALKFVLYIILIIFQFYGKVNLLKCYVCSNCNDLKEEYIEICKSPSSEDDEDTTTTISATESNLTTATLDEIDTTESTVQSETEPTMQSETESTTESIIETTTESTSQSETGFQTESTIQSETESTIQSETESTIQSTTESSTVLSEESESAESSQISVNSEIIDINTLNKETVTEIEPDSIQLLTPEFVYRHKKLLTEQLGLTYRTDVANEIKDNSREISLLLKHKQKNKIMDFKDMRQSSVLVTEILENNTLRCVKTSYEENGNIVVYRGCSFESDDHEARCREIIDNLFDGDLMSCNLCAEDLCNAAFKFTSAFILTVLRYLILVIFLNTVHEYVLFS